MANIYSCSTHKTTITKVLMVCHENFISEKMDDSTSLFKRVSMEDPGYRRGYPWKTQPIDSTGQILFKKNSSIRNKLIFFSEKRMLVRNLLKWIRIKLTI